MDNPVSSAWGEWISSMGEWHLFGGLTYDPARRLTVPGDDVAKRHVTRWLQEAPKTLGRPIDAAVVALEYQHNGWPHFHPLLRVAGGLQGNEKRLLGGAWYERHGYALLDVPRSRDDVCAYAAKYLAKDLDRGDVLFWPSRGPLTTSSPGLGV